jgi:hypothetical protein
MYQKQELLFMLRGHAPFLFLLRAYELNRGLMVHRLNFQSIRSRYCSLQEPRQVLQFTQQVQYGHSACKIPPSTYCISTCQPRSAARSRTIFRTRSELRTMCSCMQTEIWAESALQQWSATCEKCRTTYLHMAGQSLSDGCARIGGSECRSRNSISM